MFLGVELNDINQDGIHGAFNNMQNNIKNYDIFIMEYDTAIKNDAALHLFRWGKSHYVKMQKKLYM